jgi:hypothetical protein
LHLKRTLVVDEDIRAKWKKAYRKNEAACEGLGAVHLLWHGIWAFKVDARGARTDLVFNEPLENSFEERGVEGLVLTEWKVADESDARKRYEEAREQAALYKEGPLDGSELRDYRYVLAVSLRDLPPVADLTVNHVIYRHINIAIEPRTPSRQARASGRK